MEPDLGGTLQVTVATQVSQLYIAQFLKYEALHVHAKLFILLWPFQKEWTGIQNFECFPHDYTLTLTIWYLTDSIITQPYDTHLKPFSYEVIGGWHENIVQCHKVVS